MTAAIPFARVARGDAARVRVTSGANPEVVFPQSVASGDPTPSGAIVWTRLAPAAAASGSPLALQVATDAGFQRIEHEALIPAASIGASSDWTVRVDLDGLLQPDRHFWYRFVYEGVASRAGRLRTLPAEGATPERVRFAVLTCQNFQNGYFTALGHVADDDVDFVVHLGDFIYEYNGPASYNGKTFAGRGIELPSGAPRMESAEDLSYVWQRYRSDPHLMAMMERHTIIATWDDHEITNDRAFDYAEDRHRGDAAFHLNDEPAALDAFFRAGAKAWFDWMPVRVHIDPDASHPLDVVRIHRAFRFGDLAELFMLDERWHRSRQVADGIAAASPEALEAYDGARDDPDRTMLGPAQREWLIAGLRGSSRRWKLLGNPVQMSPLAVMLPRASVYVNLDAWDGYEAERRALAHVMEELRNVVVLTGDLHSYMAGYVLAGYDMAHARGLSPRVAVEFMTPGVTSAGLGEIVEQGLGNNGPMPPGFDAAHEALVLAGNPHMVHFNSNRHGYSIVELRRDRARYEGYVVDKENPMKAGNRSLMSVFEVPLGVYDIQTVHRSFPDGIPPSLDAARAYDASALDPPARVTAVRDVHDLAEAVRRAARRDPGGRTHLPAVASAPGP